MDLIECQMWVMVDEDGDWSVAKEVEDLDATAGATRLVRITVKVPRPKPVELVATVAAEPDAAELRVA